MAHAHCMLRNQGHKNTPKRCNTCCLSTAAMVKLKVYCPSCYHIHVIFDSLYPLMELISINSRTSLLSVRTIDYYINKNWPRAHAHAKQHCIAIHPFCSYAHQTSPWRGIRYRLSLNHYLEFHLLLLQFEQTQTHNSIQVTILQRTSCYTFQGSLVHHQGAYSCTNICLKLSARSSAAENSGLYNIMQ